MNYFDPVFDDDKPEVNLTSMLDIVFIMLIFFIVTASFISESGIPVFSPGPSDSDDIDVDSIVVIVEPASTFRVGNRAMSKASLLPYLTALYSQNPEATFAVVVTEGSLVKDTAAAADVGRMLGFDVIPIIVRD